MQNDADSNVSEEQTFLVVVAIDFGTTSSGYAYSFTKEPECIHVMRWVLWAGACAGASPAPAETWGRALGGIGSRSRGMALSRHVLDSDPTWPKLTVPLWASGFCSLGSGLRAARVWVSLRLGLGKGTEGMFETCPR